MKSTSERRLLLARWVAREVLPHESRVRAWLSRSHVKPDDADELIQEAYCRLATLIAFDHIGRPDAYFFSIVRNLLARRLRRQKVVPIETIAEIEAYRDEMPTPEEAASWRSDRQRMEMLITRLPERCRRIVQLRKIEGWSQRQIADHLGISEKAVEKQVTQAVRSIRKAWIDADQAADDRLTAMVPRQGWRQ